MTFIDKIIGCINILTGKYDVNKNSYIFNSYVTDELYLTDIAQKHKRNFLIVSNVILSIQFLNYISIDKNISINSVFGFGVEDSIHIDYVAILMIPILIYEAVMFGYESIASLRKYRNTEEKNHVFQIIIPSRDELDERLNTLEHYNKNNLETLKIYRHRYKETLDDLERSLTQISAEKDNVENQLRDLMESLSVLPEKDNSANFEVISNDTVDLFKSQLAMLDSSLNGIKDKASQITRSVETIDNAIKSNMPTLEKGLELIGSKFNRELRYANSLKKKKIESSNWDFLSFFLSILLPYLIFALALFTLIQ
uniref:hypothetical protein n=1 Tax=Shewanella sp. TaxID=50422 RepID=UPI004047F5DE